VTNTATPREYGEQKHERCRFGTLTPGFRVQPTIEDEPPIETPMVLPLCTFPAPEPSPPALKRGWGGSVDFEQDCAVCMAFAEVIA
jgi:hypothetical protein